MRTTAVSAGLTTAFGLTKGRPTIGVCPGCPHCIGAIVWGWYTPPTVDFSVDDDVGCTDHALFAGVTTAADDADKADVGANASPIPTPLVVADDRNYSVTSVGVWVGEKVV